MKENILYAYHIKLDNIKDEKDYSFFEIGENAFYFTKLKRTEKEFQELLLVMEELLKKNIPIFTFVPNQNNSYITMVGNVPYVLVQTNHPKVEYGILEIMNFQKQFFLNAKKSSLYRNEWATLWSSKVDFFEYQVHELGKDYPIIVNSFSYYVGLAENAIAYVNFISKRIPMPSNTPIVLSHRRVNYPNIRLNFDNPLNFIFDIEVRDVASYIKSLFFYDEELAMIDLKAYVDMRKPDLYSLSMLYARLLYPSYYFDIHEKIIEKNEKEECLLPIIDKVQDYEKFLKNVFYLFRNYVPLEPISWILKTEL